MNIKCFRRLGLIAAVFLWAGQALAQSVSTNAAAPALTNASPANTAFERSFGLDHLPWLTPRLLDVPLWQYLAMLVYILLAFLLSKLIDYVIGIRLKKWAAKTETQWDDILIKLLHGPIKVVAFVILLHIGFNVFPWPLWLAGYLSKGLVIIVACSLTYVALKLLDAFLDFWRQRSMARGADKLLDAQLLPVIRISLRVFVVIVALLLTSHNLGLNVTSLIASLSIGGLALGLAAQDTLANLFGAVSVFADRPFNVGDRIRLESVDGTVESIGIRSTRVRNGDGFLVTIPNKTMGNATITNVSRRPTIKTEMNFGLPYETSMEKLRRALTIMDEVYRGHPQTADLLISFNKFTDSALNVLVVHHWNGTAEKDYLAGLQKLNLAIKERFDQEGIEFAFPSQTHYVKQLP